MASLMESECRKRKVVKVRLGCPPRVLNLFAGCGGLSLGFHLEGFNIIGAVECDPLANLSHANNFHKAQSKQLQNAHAEPRDIVNTSPQQLVAELMLGNKVEECVDILIGGPPCQAFAREEASGCPRIDDLRPGRIEHRLVCQCRKSITTRHAGYIVSAIGLLSIH